MTQMPLFRCSSLSTGPKRRIKFVCQATYLQGILRCLKLAVLARKEVEGKGRADREARDDIFGYDGPSAMTAFSNRTPKEETKMSQRLRCHRD